MNKNFLTMLLVLGMVCMVFVGCKKQAADGPVVLNLYEHSDNEKVINLLADKFNADHADIKVVIHMIPDDSYDDKIKVLASGNSGELDVFWIRTPSQTQQYITNNVLLDLTSLAKESGLDLAPIQSGIKAVSDTSGKFYGLPTTGSCWMVFYNKDLFDAKGLPYPVDLTWDEYADLAKRLTYTEGNVKYWGGLIPPWFLNLGAAAAKEYITAPEPMTQTQAYTRFLHRIYVDDKSHPGLGEMNQGSFDVYAYFNSNNIYMMVNGDWSFKLLDTPFNYGAAPLPTLPGVAKGSSVGQASILAISRTSKHPKEAFEFIKWATTSPEGTSIYASFLDIPSYPTAEALAVYQQNMQVPGVEYRFSASIGPETGYEPYYNDLMEAFNQETQLYLLGEKTQEQAFRSFYELRKEILASQ